MSRLLLTLIVIAFASVTYGQDYFEQQAPAATKSWRPASGFVSFGIDWDRYNSMSLDRMMQFAADPSAIERDLSEFDEAISPETAGAYLSALATWNPLNKKTGQYNADQELLIGMRISSPKEAMVTYQSETLDSSIVFCNLHGEINLQAAYLFKGNWGKRWQWHIGAGWSGGWSTGNEMILLSGKYYDPELHPSTQDALTEEHFAAKSVYYTRLSLPYGIAFQTGDHMHIGLNFKRNVGLQFIQGEQSAFIPASGSFGLSFQYNW